MTSKNHLSRFLEAQNGVYDNALNEIKNGRKTSHWMWYIFPQINGLGLSDTSKYYAIKDKREAGDYLNHAILGSRLTEISNALLKLQTNDPVTIFGSIDSVKLKSSMTLFSLLENSNPVFQKVLDKYFDGEMDQKTIQIVNAGKQAK